MVGLKILHLLIFLDLTGWPQYHSLQNHHQLEMEYTFLSRFFPPFDPSFFWRIFLCEETGCTWSLWCSERRIREFSTLLYRPCGHLGHEWFVSWDCMYLDSGRLYRSSLRAYSSLGWYVKIRMSFELYGWFGMSSIRIDSNGSANFFKMLKNVPNPPEFLRTVHTVPNPPRIDPGKRFGEIRLLFDRGLGLANASWIWHCNVAGVLSWGTAAVRMPVGKYVPPATNYLFGGKM